jgi:cysteine synthase
VLTEPQTPTSELADEDVLRRTAERFRAARVALPTFAQLADPRLIPPEIRGELAAVGPDDAHPLNLFRVHWHNGATRVDVVEVPEHLVLPTELTGVEARVVVVLGDRFPMIGAHKVLAAYGCLAPRLIEGTFDPGRQRAVWPSTGNYCRGGVAISRLLGCRGVAVLPEGMSRERFAWLERWVSEPEDIVRTPGSESNVKEIYDMCRELAADPGNVILNQFAEYGNYAVHYTVTGRALERVFEALADESPELRLRAFVSATGSAGTIAAGDYLKERHGALVVACEALECPTMLRNGFGEHNIQGIGDKHIPLIHNVLNTDVALAVSDRATDRLGLLFGTEAGRAHLAGRRGVPDEVISRLDSLGLSSICNVLGAIKTAKHFGLGPNDVIVTVATDGAAMYASERELALSRQFPDGFDDVAAAEVFGEHLLGAATDNLLELTHEDRERIFNLGYFTWVEQQGVALDEFQARRDPRFWRGKREAVAAWDEQIAELNARTGVLEAP